MKNLVITTKRTPKGLLKLLQFVLDAWENDKLNGYDTVNLMYKDELPPLGAICKSYSVIDCGGKLKPLYSRNLKNKRFKKYINRQILRNNDNGTNWTILFDEIIDVLKGNKKLNKKGKLCKI